MIFLYISRDDSIFAEPYKLKTKTKFHVLAVPSDTEKPKVNQFWEWSKDKWIIHKEYEV